MNHLENVEMLDDRRSHWVLKLPSGITTLSWDAEIVDELKPSTDDHVVIKRRDSVFQDTEFEVWLQSLGIDALIFSGIDTSICVESSLRDAFNHGYDIVMISDATASNNFGHYNSTLDNIRNYYGLVMNFDELTSYFEKEISS